MVILGVYIVYGTSGDGEGNTDDGVTTVSILPLASAMLYPGGQVDRLRTATVCP